jgi:hypothetical protein
MIFIDWDFRPVALLILLCWSILKLTIYVVED